MQSRKNQMNNKTLKKPGISILFLLLLLVIVKYFIDKNSLEKEYRVTIGSVYDYEVLTKSGYDLYYYYTVNGNQYKGDYIV